MAVEGGDELVIRAIQAGDRLSGLSLGDAAFTPLKIFLQKQAAAYEKAHLARTYGAFHPTTGKILAYITLVCGEVNVGKDDKAPIDDDGLKYKYLQYPAVKIARLAVDNSQRSAGLGSAMVELALGIAKEVICPAVGCRFMMVDSKRASVGFYERCGFTRLDSGANRDRAEPVMFIDLSKIEAPAG